MEPAAGSTTSAVTWLHSRLARGRPSIATTHVAALRSPALFRVSMEGRLGWLKDTSQTDEREYGFFARVGLIYALCPPPLSFSFHSSLQSFLLLFIPP